MILITGTGLKFAGAPLDVGQALSFDSATEAAMVATGNAIYYGNYGSVLTLTQSHMSVACPQDTNENTVWQYVVPGGLLGPSDSLRVSAAGLASNSVNSKTFRLKAGGTTIATAAPTASGGGSVAAMICSRGSLSQIARPFNTGTSAPVPLTINTAKPFVLSITGQLANAADTMSLDSVLVELQRAAG